MPSNHLAGMWRFEETRVEIATGRHTKHTIAKISENEIICQGIVPEPCP